MYIKCEMDLDEGQFGFQEGMGTWEAMFRLFVQLQKCRDQRKDLYICFIDYEKAFAHSTIQYPARERLR